MDVRRLVLGTGVAILLLAGGLPVAALAARAFQAGTGAGPFPGLPASPREWTLLGNSLLLAALTSAGAMIAGVPAAFLVARTDLPGRRALAAVLTLPLLLPPYLTAAGWLAAGSPSGPVARLVGRPAAAALAEALQGLPGTVLVLATAFAPLVMLLTAAALAGLPGRLEEAGLITAPRRTVLRRITLPLVAPAAGLGASLAFLLALGEVTVAPALRFPVYAVEILTRFAAFYDIDAAVVAAVPLALVTAVVLAGETFLARRTGLVGLRGGRAGPPPPRYALGTARTPAALAAWAVTATLAGVPLAVLVLRAGGPASYADALAQAGGSLVRGLALAAASGTLLAAEGFVLAVLVLESPGLPARAVDAAALFLFALPGAVLGVGLIVLWNHPWAGIVTGTPAILLLGHLAHGSAVTLRLSRSALALVPAGLVEAARTAGAGWGRRLVWILAPVARRGILAAWLAGAVLALRDVGMTLLVHPPGWDTLPVRIMTLSANGSPGTIAALCVLLAAVTAVPLAAIAGLLGGAGATR